MTYLASDLITSVRRRANRPPANADDRVSDTDILAIANEETHGTIMPMLISAGEEYYIRSEDLSVDSSGYARIPSKAVAAAVRDITWIESSSATERSLAAIPLEEQGSYVATSNFGQSYRNGYVIQGDKIRVLPSPPSSGGTLRVYYAWRPGLLTTDTTKYAAVNGIDTGAGPGADEIELTLSSNAGSWTTSSKLDVVQGSPNFDLLLYNVSATTISGSDFRFGPTSLEVAVGDYVCDTGYTPVVQVPVELQHVLAEAVVIRTLMLAGDYEAMQYHEAKLRQTLSSSMTLYEPRNKGENHKIVNRHSALRFGGRYRGSY